MNRSRRSKIKNNVLISITGLAFVAFFAAGSCIDTPSPVPAIIVLASLGWIAIFALANNGFEKVQKDSRWEK